MPEIVRAGRIVWREARLTFGYRGSRRGGLLLGISAVILTNVVSDFFDRPRYEGEFVSSIVFTAIVLTAYIIVVTTLRRARGRARTQAVAAPTPLDAQLSDSARGSSPAASREVSRRGMPTRTTVTAHVYVIVRPPDQDGTRLAFACYPAPAYV